MKLDELKASISEIVLNKDCSAEFYFLIEENGSISIKRADVDQGASDELARNFIQMIDGYIIKNNEISLLKLSGADDRKDAVYHYDLPDVPAQIKHLSTLLGSDDFELFDFKNDELINLKGIVVILGHGQKQLALYKHQYPVALLKRDSGFSLVKVRNGNRLVKLEDDILRISNKFEFMCINNEYFVLDIKTLERFFGFHDAVKNIAIEGIANIEASAIIVDTTVLKERIDDITFARKLVRASKDSPVLGIIPSDQVIGFIENHPSLKGRFRLSDDRLKIKLDTKVSQNLFLQILNDDFLQSQLTKSYYASLAKDKLEAEV